MIAYAASQRIDAGLADLTVGDHAFTVRPRWPLQDI